MDYNFIKANIDRTKNFAEKLDMKSLNSSPNKAHEKHLAFIHNYAELAQEIRRVINDSLTNSEQKELLTEIADTVTILTTKLKEIE